MEYDSSDDDLISHITNKQQIELLNELDKFLKIDRASALCNTLDWWKVSLFIN